ncbi:hypothetical protein CK203_075649 [Vitis vinifera]|uniref:Uncharacterized protein n=1 Tax=Vitis vinifera TaxID=29760 RepID=A0A438EGP9_VITVI|nr:hypothetical protein CK203_075649 [Vitis vinifera]
MEFVADAAKLAEILERERSHELLFGLKLKFDECEVQNQYSGRTISNAREADGLYYFEGMPLKVDKLKLGVAVIFLFLVVIK